jgi:hypothetical protein
MKTQRNRAVILRTRLKRCGEGKSIPISKSTPTPRTDAGVAFMSGVQYVILIKGNEGSILVSAHACTVYAVWRIKSKTKQMLPTVHSTQPNLT